MHNACTWVGCNYDRQLATEAMTDNGRAWAHLCPTHKVRYDAEMKAMSINSGIDYSSARLHDLMVVSAGGSEAWRRFLFGPFGKTRDKPKVDEESAAP